MVDCFKLSQLTACVPGGAYNQKPMRLRCFAVLVCCVSVAPSLINGQTAPEVTFKVEVNSIEEDVRVLDKAGTFVRGLTRDDFQIIENGKPQKIATFGLVDLPFTPFEPSGDSPLPIESDVVSNQHSQDGRLYLIVLDDYHVDPSRTPQVQRLVRQFILDKLGTNDQAAIVTTSGKGDAAQDFTQSRRRLLAAVDHFSGQKLPSVTAALLDIATRDTSTGAPTTNPDSGVVAARRTPNTFLNDGDIAERVQRARLAIGTLANLSNWLSRVRGRRKALVYVSEGIDYTNYGAFTGPDSATRNFEQVKEIEDQLQDAISAATRGNVQIYPVDPRGLVPMASDFQVEDARATISVRETMNAERAVSQERLRELADKTGGVVATGANDLPQAFDRIVRESSSYYVLGYYSSNDKPDGKVRTVDVKVKGYPGALVSFRKEYTAASPPKTKSSTPESDVIGLLTDAMTSPLPLSGLPFRFTAIPHRGLGKNANLELLMEFEKDTLKFRRNGDTYDNTLYVSIAAITKAGKSAAEERRAIELKLKADTYQRVNRSGVRVLRQLDVSPGTYSVHVAVSDAVERKQGSVHVDVDAPDFTGGSLALSGVALTAATGVAAYAVGADDFARALPAAPTAQRVFSSGDTLAVLLEVYDNDRTSSHTIDLRLTVKAADGHAVFEKNDEAMVDAKEARTAMSYRSTVPLLGWTAGAYVLTVEGISRVGNATPVSRVIPFAVR
jgi:VWFA-related protein